MSIYSECLNTNTKTNEVLSNNIQLEDINTLIENKEYSITKSNVKKTKRKTVIRLDKIL